MKQDLPSADANQIANNLSNLGQIYNREDSSTDVLARGQVLGDGIRVHSLVLPGLPSSTTVHFSGLGEVCPSRNPKYKNVLSSIAPTPLRKDMYV